MTPLILPNQIKPPDVALLEIGTAESQHSFQAVFAIDTTEPTAEDTLSDVEISAETIEQADILVFDQDLEGSDISALNIDVIDAEVPTVDVVDHEAALSKLTVAKPGQADEADTMEKMPVQLSRTAEALQKAADMGRDVRSLAETAPREAERAETPTAIVKPGSPTQVVAVVSSLYKQPEPRFEHPERPVELGAPGSVTRPNTAHSADAVAKPLKPALNGLILRSVSTLEWSSLTRGEATALADLAPITGGIERPATTVSTAIFSGATAETARPVMQQIATAMVTSNANTIEVALNPEELGRVRLQISGVDGALTLQLTAERPETMELLRRHIDLLAHDLEKLGYDTLSFSFGQEDQPEHEQHDDQAEFNPFVIDEVADQTKRPSDKIRTAGLDLRL